MRDALIALTVLFSLIAAFALGVGLFYFLRLRRDRVRDERGIATIECMVVLAFGMLVMAGLMVTTAWPTKANAASAAAYEAARAMVEAPNADEGAELGRRRAAEVMSNHGYDPADLEVTYSSAERGEALTAEVHITLPALAFPGLGTWDALPWTATRTVRVPDFRSYD